MLAQKNLIVKVHASIYLNKCELKPIYEFNYELGPLGSTVQKEGDGPTSGGRIFGSGMKPNHTVGPLQLGHCLVKGSSCGFQLVRGKENGTQVTNDDRIRWWAMVLLGPPESSLQPF